MLKIETGELKGKVIQTVPDNRTRYTSSIIRRALASMVDFEGKYCADICCGSGNVGFEMISNGANYVVFVDVSQKAINTVKNNAKNLGVEEKTQVIKDDARRFLEKFDRKFEIIYSDPPYELGIVKDIIERVHLVMKEDSLFILQCSKREIPKQTDLKNLKPIKMKEYGDSYLIFFQKYEKIY
ncbi:MAG: RsmD family RNA methyltransferase [Fervidobacterium sp.]